MSTSLTSFMRAPQRMLREMYGAPDMDSQPPTSII